MQPIIGACMPTLIPVYRQLRYGDPLKSSTAGSAGLSNKTPMLKGSKGTSARRKQSRTSGSFERPVLFAQQSYRQLGLGVNRCKMIVGGARVGQMWPGLSLR